jgi:hypothetical protein
VYRYRKFTKEKMIKCSNKYELLGRVHTTSQKRFFTDGERIAFEEGALFVLKRLNFDSNGNIC